MTQRAHAGVRASLATPSRGRALAPTCRAPARRSFGERASLATSSRVCGRLATRSLTLALCVAACVVARSHAATLDAMPVRASGALPIARAARIDVTGWLDAGPARASHRTGGAASLVAHRGALTLRAGELMGGSARGAVLGGGAGWSRGAWTLDVTLDRGLRPGGAAIANTSTFVAGDSLEPGRWVTSPAARPTPASDSRLVAARAAWTRGALQVRAIGGIEATRGALRRWLRASGTWWLRSDVGVTLGAGALPASVLEPRATSAGVGAALDLAPAWPRRDGARADAPSAPRFAAHPSGGRAWRIDADVPGAASVEVAGEFSDWSAVPLEPLGRGRFRGRIDAAPGSTLMWRIDGGAWDVPPSLARRGGAFGDVGVLPSAR